MSQLDRAKANLHAVEAEKKSPQKALSTAVDVLHDATGRQSRQQHEFTGRHH